MAKTIYIAQTTQGGDTGVDAANAHSAAWFNTAGNWGAGGSQINPGDTVRLTGNITTALSTQANGTAGNITTILFDTGATMSKSTWDQFGAIGVNHNYITVNGGATGTIGGPAGNAALSNGIIESTDNGQASLGYGNQVTNAVGVFVQSHDVTVKNLVVRNLFIRASGTDQTSNGNSGVKVDVSTGNVTVTNCIFHDNERGAYFVIRAGTSNYTCSFVTAYNCNWGGAAGTADVNTDLTGLYVYNNYFYGWSNWDDTSANNTYHHNGFFTFTSFSQSGTSITTVRYYNNKVGSGTSGEWGTRSSSGLWVQDKCYDVLSYNNLCINDDTTYAHDGLLFYNPQGAITSTWGAYNNTLIGLSNSVGNGLNLDSWQNSGGSLTVTLRNNIIKGTRFAVTVYDNSPFTITSNHNLIFGNDASTPYSYSSTSSGVFKSIAQWQALGFDTDLLTSDPTLSATYSLTLGSPAISVGANLASIFTTDYNGSTRSPTGSWDLGAFAYSTDAQYQVHKKITAGRRH